MGILHDSRRGLLLLRLAVLADRGQKVSVVMEAGQVPYGNRSRSRVLLELRSAHFRGVRLGVVDYVSPTGAHLLKLLERLRVHGYRRCCILQVYLMIHVLEASDEVLTALIVYSDQRGVISR